MRPLHAASYKAKAAKTEHVQGALATDSASVRCPSQPLTRTSDRITDCTCKAVQKFGQSKVEPP